MAPSEPSARTCPPRPVGGSDSSDVRTPASRIDDLSLRQPALSRPGLPRSGWGGRWITAEHKQPRPSGPTPRAWRKPCRPDGRQRGLEPGDQVGGDPVADAPHRSVGWPRGPTSPQCRAGPGRSCPAAASGSRRWRCRPVPAAASDRARPAPGRRGRGEADEAHAEVVGDVPVGDGGAAVEVADRGAGRGAGPPGVGRRAPSRRRPHPRRRRRGSGRPNATCGTGRGPRTPCGRPRGELWERRCSY